MQDALYLAIPDVLKSITRTTLLQLRRILVTPYMAANTMMGGIGHWVQLL